MGFIITVIVWLIAILIIISPAVILFWMIAAIIDVFKGKKSDDSYPPPLDKYLK